MKETLKQIVLKLDIIRLLTALTLLFILILIVVALLFFKISEGNRELVIHVLGIIEGGFMTLVTYEFGTSKQKSKTQTEPQNEEK